MTVAQMLRMIWIDAVLNDTAVGLRRSTMQLIFDQSIPQTSLDIRRFMNLWPDRMIYDKSAKEYRAAPGSTPVFPPDISILVRLSCVTAREFRDDLEGRKA